jgi:four helix bundle protein
MGESFKDLVVWQRAVEMSLAIYKFASSFPDSERFGLTNQLRRASVSVTSNIERDTEDRQKANSCSFLATREVPILRSKPNW